MTQKESEKKLKEGKAKAEETIARLRAQVIAERESNRHRRETR